LTVGASVSKVEPSDAVIIYNGAEIKSSSNILTVNGLTVTVKGVTDEASDETVSVNITRNTQTIYDMIKGFVKSYNEVLKELNDSYDADTAKGYEPLTDEEREAMTDDQIEKWEKKIKDSLLRRDGTVGSLINTMRTALSGSVDYNGKAYSFASLGITSISYTEKGLLHIDGDKEDVLSASEDDKLMKALSENPDAVMEVFTKLTGELYSKMQEDMKSTSLSSALTFYNDKEIKGTIDDYKQELADMEDRLTDMENRYYRQFTAMETAMSKMNSQSSSIMSLLGMNTNSK
jgi:flagellar hook-associated protein 2